MHTLFTLWRVGQKLRYLAKSSVSETNADGVEVVGNTSVLDIRKTRPVSQHGIVLDYGNERRVGLQVVVFSDVSQAIFHKECSWKQEIFRKYFHQVLGSISSKKSIPIIRNPKYLRSLFHIS